MANPKPDAEVTISHDLIHQLLAEHVPHLADEPVELVASGWDNEIHRVGEHHAVRLPRRELAAALVANEQRWLPELADRLPVDIPVPVHAGGPAFGYPWSWSVVPWLPGVPLAHAPALDQQALIDDLAGFLNALHVPAPDDAPDNPYRGIALRARTEKVREHVAACGDLIDGDAALALWDELVDTPPWGGEPMWVHGDLHPMNILIRAGRVSAVIDFGDLCSGDPATDLAIAWMCFDPEGRDAFRKALRIDDKTIGVHTWNRARGWALGMGLAYLAFSADDPTMRRIGQTTLGQVLG